jgi:hypothetical protein
MIPDPVRDDPAELTRERELVVRLSRVDDDADNDARLPPLLERPLDWNWVVVTATRHKVVQLMWHNMIRKDLIAPAMGTGGLPELWTVYISQMYAAGRERNRLWMANAADLASAFDGAGLRVAVIKGGALIGDLYSIENRFLNDVDFLACRVDLEKVKECMFDRGFRYGSYNYATGRVDPIERRVERAWIFNNHVLPNFYRLTDDALTPYVKVQVGYDFFDPFEDFTVDGAAVVERAVPKGDGSGLLVPSKIDTLVNLCCHIYREGVSVVYHDYNVNWQLGKFCDLLGFLLKHDAELDIDAFVARVDAEDIRRPVYYALHHTDLVYGHPVLGRWLSATDPGERAYLDELRDGDRRAVVDQPFHDRLFSLRVVGADFQGGWNRQFTRDQW